MALVSPQKVVYKAMKDKKAIGAFNVLNLETTRAVIEAAEEMQSPIIIQISKNALKWSQFHYLVPLVLSAVRKSSVNIGVHLDHTTNFEQIKNAIATGFTSIMYDGSKLSYSENIVNSLKVNKLAKKSQIVTEFEIGIIGGKEGENNYQDETSIEQIIDFYNQTKPSFLAANFGTIHSLQNQKININYGLIKSLSQKLAIPLVLYGSSGVSFGDLARAIKLGIAKVNVGSALLEANFKAIRKYLIDNPNAYNIRKIHEVGIKAIKNIVKTYLKLFNS